MDDDRPLGERRREALLRLLGLLALAVSPLGAPAIGLLLVAGCDISWMEPSHCAIPDALVTYFVTFTLIPMAAGGVLFTILWLLAAAGLLLACLVQAAKLLWLILVERPVAGLDFDPEQANN